MAPKNTAGAKIGQFLIQELFNEENIAKCGPSGRRSEVDPDNENVIIETDEAAFSYSQNFSKIDKGIDKHLKKNFNHVPHETYRPQIAAGLDFTDSFTASLQPETSQYFSVEAKRLVDPSILMGRAREILNFVRYYFEYTGTYKTYSAETGERTDIHLSFAELSKFKVDTEEDANRLLNEVFNMFITSINITRARNDSGSATIVFKNVRNYIDGKSFGPLYSYIKIWARGRFYNEWFFPIYDGYIVSTSVKDAAGFAEIEITCKDVLEIARFTTEMINPALINIAEARKVWAINLQAMPFYGHDHMDLVRALLLGDNLEFDPTGEKTKFLNETDSYGNVRKGFKFIKGIGPVPVDSAGNLIQAQQDRLLTGRINLNKKINLKKLRATRIAAAKKQGITPTLDLQQLEEFDYISNVDPDSVNMLDGKLEEGPIRDGEFNIERILKEVSHAQTRRKLIAWGTRITPYRVWEVQSPDTFNATFSSRLDILLEIAQNVYYDIYVDGAGNVHYHPQRFSNDYLFNDAMYARPGEDKLHAHPAVWPGIYVIAPEESLSHSENVNFEELVTFIKLRGQDPSSAAEADIGNIVGSAIHRDYLSRFGYRRMLTVNPMFNYNFSLDATADSISTAAVTFMDIAAASLLIYSNGSLHTKNSTIIFRPELDVARPLYYAEDDMVYYIDSISHSITIGGDATTTITASFGRKIHEMPIDLQSFIQIQEGRYKFGVEFLESKAFIKQLPINDWENFLTENQMHKLFMSKLELPDNYIAATDPTSDDYVGPREEDYLGHDWAVTTPELVPITPNPRRRNPRKGKIRLPAKK
jgi:hypothetical protein